MEVEGEKKKNDVNTWTKSHNKNTEGNTILGNCGKQLTQTLQKWQFHGRQNWNMF